jgi:RNA polymerase sigma-70 factor (ECF subfamily)
MSSRSHDSHETQRLLARVRDGSAAARDELFARHRAYLRRFVEFRLDPRLRQRIDPSDVIQEAQLEAARRLPPYSAQPPLPFRLWLRQITYDRLLMLQRRHAATQRRDVTREVALPEESGVALADQICASAASPSQVLVRDELARRVRVALADLADDDREVVLLRHVEGLSNAEAALVLKIAPDTASKRYGRALLRLRARLVEVGLTQSAPGGRDTHA